MKVIEEGADYPCESAIAALSHRARLMLIV